MIGALGRRVAAAIPVLFVVTLVTFLLVTITPGDPADLLAGESASPERLDAIRATLGLDRSVGERFLDYIGGLLTGDWGTSLFSGQSVLEEIAEVLPVTLSITLMTFVLTLAIGIPLGVAAAVNRDGAIDRFTSAVGSFFIGVPPFVSGMLLIAAFALTLQLFPPTGYVSIQDGGFAAWTSHLFLPSLALALPSAAEVARQLRGALVDTLEQDFIRAQRAKGLPPATVLWKHGLKNAAPPVITVLGLQLGRILGGTVIVEQVFAIPGFGSMTLQAVVQHDYPLIQAAVLVSALLIICTNVLTDAVEVMVNPRLRSST